MTIKQIAFEDMRKAGLNVSFFLYDVWFGDARRFNGEFHPKKSSSPLKLESKTSH